ncbi:MAG TPA: hemerythrin domain-containing protein [Acidimicrobiia bacterium]
MERIDLLRFIHKALRHATLSTNLESGRVDYADADATKRLDEAWMLLRENLGHHASHEDEFIFPLLDARAPGESEGLKHDHAVIQQLEADLTDLLDRLHTKADADLRRLLGREFHRSMQRYTAVCLTHFDDEERHLMPRLWALYEDDELAAAYGQIMAAIEPEEREYAMAHMTEALDPVELETLRVRLAS